MRGVLFVSLTWASSAMVTRSVEQGWSAVKECDGDAGRRDLRATRGREGEV